MMLIMNRQQRKTLLILVPQHQIWAMSESAGCYHHHYFRTTKFES